MTRSCGNAPFHIARSAQDKSLSFLRRRDKSRIPNLPYLSPRASTRNRTPISSLRARRNPTIPWKRRLFLPSLDTRRCKNPPYFLRQLNISQIVARRSKIWSHQSIEREYNFCKPRREQTNSWSSIYPSEDNMKESTFRTFCAAAIIIMFGIIGWAVYHHFEHEYHDNDRNGIHIQTPGFRLDSRPTDDPRYRRP